MLRRPKRATSLATETVLFRLASARFDFLTNHRSGRGGLPKTRLNRALEYIEANLDRDLHLDELAKACGFSSFHFAKLFKQSTGASPHQYVLERRLERAKALLRMPELSLSQISLDTGFADQSHLTNVFRKFLGVSPAKFRASL